MGRRPKQTLCQRRYTDGQQTHEKILNIIIIREMQIKTTVRYHLMSIKMVIINKTTNKKNEKKLQTINAREDVEKKNPLVLLL